MSAAGKSDAFDPTLPLERAHTIPSRWYRDADIHLAERRRIWSDSWQVVARADQLEEPGTLVTCDVAGEPLVIVRGHDGVLRGFFNVCRHRAACVATGDTRHVSRLRCRYHGWTYDLAGRLIGTPEFDGVADFDRADYGLRPISVATWGKWVWMHLRPDPPSLADQLAPLPDQADVLQLDSLRFVERREYELACNWKVFVDNYLDGGYHVNTVHPGLAGVLNYAQYRTDVFRTTSVQISPLRPAQSQELEAVQSVRSGTHAYYWWVYPNFMINVYAGVMDTNQVLPLGPDRCRVIFEFYFADTGGSEAKKFMADSMAVAHEVQLEDVSVCEEVQRGLASQSYCTGRFSVRREAAGYQFHRLLGAALCDS